MTDARQSDSHFLPGDEGRGGVEINRVCALIPAYNEEDRIGTTVDALRSRREIVRIVVVDDGSTDHTADAARNAGADEVISQVNAGKGAALTTAFKLASETADIFLLLDADLGATATEAIKLLFPIVAGEADMTIGLLPPDPDFAASGASGGGGMVVRLANKGIHKATGQTFKQPLCGQRAVRREVLETLAGRTANGGMLFADGFGVEVGLTISALRAGFRVVEVETHFRHHVTASDWSGLLHRARQYVDVARTVRRCLRESITPPSSPPGREKEPA